MPRGRLTLVFDDGYRDVFDNVVPLLAEHGIPAVFAVPLDNETTSLPAELPRTPWETWAELQSEQFEIAAHSVSHTNLTRLDDTELTEELTKPHEALRATTLVYPGGAHDDRVVKAANMYQAGRTVKAGFNTLKPGDPMRLSTYNYTRDSFSVKRANRHAWWAKLTNRWLIETYHLVTNAPAEYPYTVSFDEFKEHLAYIRSLNIDITTIAGAL